MNWWLLSIQLSTRTPQRPQRAFVVLKGKEDLHAIYTTVQHGARLRLVSNPMISGSHPPGAGPHLPYYPSIVPRINVPMEPQKLALRSTSLQRPITTAIRGPNVLSLYQSYSTEWMEILCFFLPRMRAGFEARSSMLASSSRIVVRDNGCVCHMEQQRVVLGNTQLSLARSHMRRKKAFGGCLGLSLASLRLKACYGIAYIMR